MLELKISLNEIKKCSSNYQWQNNQIEVEFNELDNRNLETIQSEDNKDTKKEKERAATKLMGCTRIRILRFLEGEERGRKSN